MRLKVWAVAAVVAAGGCGQSDPPPPQPDGPDGVAAREREQDAASKRERGAKPVGEQPDVNPANP